MSDLALNILINAQDSASAILRNVGTAISDLGSGNVLGAVAAVGTAVVGIGVGAVKAAGDFQASMTKLVTSAGENSNNLQLISNGIKQIAVDTGTSTDQLAAGMYYVESSGIHAASALATLRVAAEGAKSENADLTTVSKALTTVLTDYHMDTSNAAAATLSSTQAMNGLIATVQNGKTSLQELSSSMGAVLPIASSLGISFPQVAGAMDTMTNAGMTSRQAAMNLAHVLLALSSPSGVAVKSMDAVGLSAQQVKDALVHQGLPEALQMIEDAVGKKFPAGSVQYETALKNITGGIMGFKLAAQLTGDSLKQTEANIEKVTAAMAGAKNGVLGWDLVQQNFNFQLDRAKQALQVLLINIGQQLLPGLTKIAAAITPVIVGFANWVSQSNIIGNALSAVGTVLQWLFGLFQQAWSVLQQVGAAIAPIFDNLASQAQTWGQNVMAGFIAGIESLIGDLESIMNQVAQSIADFIGFASPSKRGPGRNLMSWGPAMVKGFADGIRAGADRDMDDAISHVTKHFGKLHDKDDAKRRGRRRAEQDRDAEVQAAQTSSASNGPNSNGVLATVSLASSGAGSAHSRLTSALHSNTSALAQARLALSEQKLALDQHKFAFTKSLDQQKLALDRTKVALQEHKLALDQNKLALTKSVDAQKLALQEQKLHLEALKANTKALSSRAKGGGAGGALGTASNAAKQLSQIKVPDIGKQISDSVKHGVDQAKQRLTEMVSPITKDVSVALSRLAPAWKSIKDGAISVWQVVQSELIPSLKQVWQALSPAFTMFKELAGDALKVGQAIGTWLTKGGGLAAMWQGFIGVVKIVIAVLSTVFTIIGKTLAPVFRQLAQTVQTQIMPAFKQLWQAIQPLLPTLRDMAIVLGGILLAALGILLGVIGGVLRGLAGFISGMIQAVGGVIQIFSGLITFFIGFFQFIIDLFSGNWSKLGDDLKTMWSGMVLIVEGAWNTIEGIINAGIGLVKGLIWGFISTIITYFQNLYNALVGHSIIPDLVNGILQWFTTLITAGPQTLQKLVDWMTTTFNNLLSDATNWGRNLIGNIINGINSMLGNVAQAASNVAQTIANYLHWASPTKKGPGASSDKWGGNLVKTIAHSMTEHISYINAAAGQIAAAANPWASQASIVNGIELPDYATGTGYFSMNTPYAQPSQSVTVGAIHVHLNTSDRDAEQHGKKVAEVAKRELAKMLRQQSIAPRYTSGGH